MSDRCPLGEDCDLTLAWMAGHARGQDAAWNAAILRAIEIAEGHRYAEDVVDDLRAEVKEADF
jgi:hypothetical protein